MRENRRRMMMKWWKDLVSLLLPLFRCLILARHLVPSTNVCAHRGTKTLRRFTHELVLILRPCAHTHTHTQTKSLSVTWSHTRASPTLHHTTSIHPPAVLALKAFCAYTPHTITHPNNESPSFQLFYSHANKHTPAELAAVTDKCWEQRCSFLP